MHAIMHWNATYVDTLLGARLVTKLHVHMRFMESTSNKSQIQMQVRQMSDAQAISTNLSASTSARNLDECQMDMQFRVKRACTQCVHTSCVQMRWYTVQVVHVAR